MVVNQKLEVNDAASHDVEDGVIHRADANHVATARGYHEIHRNSWLWGTAEVRSFLLFRGYMLQHHIFQLGAQVNKRAQDT